MPSGVLALVVDKDVSLITPRLPVVPDRPTLPPFLPLYPQLVAGSLPSPPSGCSFSSYPSALLYLLNTISICTYLDIVFIHLNILILCVCVPLATPKKAVSPLRAGTVSSTFFLHFFFYPGFQYKDGFLALAKNSINVD